jgi:hypothetical protein
LQPGLQLAPGEPSPSGPRAAFSAWVRQGGFRALVLAGLGLVIIFGAVQITGQDRGWDVICGVVVGELLAIIGLVAGLLAALRSAGRLR